jgi:predicted RNA binding protein YcfA (HicA-like mRNA interferase family)
MKGDRLLPVSGRELVRVFSRIGFAVVRQRGSHIVMARGEEILVVPDHDVVAKGTERDLIRDAGISVSEFNQFL